MQLYAAPRHRRALRVRRASFVGKLLAIAGVLGALLMLMLASLGPAPAHAQIQVLEPRLAAVREAYRQVRHETYWCARDGGVALARAGATTLDQLDQGAAKLCASKMVAFLTIQAGYPEFDAQRHTAEIVLKGVDDAVASMQK